MIDVNPGIVPESGAELFQCCDRSLARTRLHCRAVPRDLETTAMKLDDERPVIGVLHCLRGFEVLASLFAAKRPDRFRTAHPALKQQIVKRLDIVDRGDVGVVENREGKPLSVWKKARTAGARVIESSVTGHASTFS